MEEPGVGISQSLDIIAIHITIETRIPPGQSTHDCIDRRLQINHQVRHGRFHSQVFGNLVIQLELFRIEIELRKQAVSSKQVIGNLYIRKQIRLSQVFNLPRPRKQEKHLRGQSGATPVSIETLEERILLHFFENQVRGQAVGKSPRQRRLTDPNRSLDGNVAGRTA